MRIFISFIFLSIIAQGYLDAQAFLDAQTNLEAQSYLDPQAIPAWMDEVSGYEQPEWFNSRRVHIHTRNAIYWKPDTEIYSQYGEMLSELGAEVYTRHVKTREDPVFWITAVGSWDPQANTRNVVQEAIDNAHENGCNMIAYYTHYTDSYFKENYPDWQCRDVNGETIYHTGRGTHICFNTPYADSVLVRLLEVAEMGADGIYFDGKHMPSEGCWCVHCKAKFKELTGLDAPTVIDDSQLYKDYQTFNNNSIRDAFLKWRRGLLAEYPDLVMLVGSNIFPQYIARHLSSDLMRVAGAHKTEWDLAVRRIKKGILPDSIPVPDVETFMGMNFTFIRDVGDGRPAHVWIPGMSFVPWDHIQAAAAGQIAFGNIANLDMKEEFTPDLDFVPAIELGHTLSPIMHHAKPLRWLLIHYNEAAQEHFLPDQSAAWINNIYPMYGAYYTAQEMKIPTGFITDSQILQGHFQDAKVIFLPNAEIISSDLKISLDAFKAAGGTIIEQVPEWRWHADSTGFENARAGLTEMLDQVSTRALIYSEGGNSFYHARYYQKMLQDTSKYIAAYSNKLDWIVFDATEENVPELLAASVPPGNVERVFLRVRKDEAPVSVREIVNGQGLTWLIEEGSLKVEIPSFRFSAFIEIAYKVHDPATSVNQIKYPVIPSLYVDAGNDQLVLENTGNPDFYEIYSLTGHKVAEGRIIGGKLSIQKLQSGIYLIRIEGGINPFTAKFAKM